jgi:hypothetical protein
MLQLQPKKKRLLVTYVLLHPRNKLCSQLALPLLIKRTQSASWNNIRSGQFGRKLSRVHANDCGISDFRVCQQKFLEVCWRDLEALIFDEFLQTVDDAIDVGE